MELLYIWTKTHEDLFDKIELNLSPEFSFSILEERTANGVNYTLEETHNWKNKVSIFRDKNILNVTAIVGKNGTGKTTLLEILGNFRILDFSQISKKFNYIKEKCKIIIIRNDKIKVSQTAGL